MLVLVAALALGLGLQHLVAVRLAAIQALARSDVLAARAELAALFRVGGIALFGTTGALGIALAAASRRAIRSEVFPPPGVWSWPDARVITGPKALRLASVSLALAVLLVACSAAGGGLAWYMAAKLLACRAP